MKFLLLVTFLFIAIALSQAAHGEESLDEACEVIDSETSAHSNALLQVQKKRGCSWALQANEDGSQVCASLQNRDFTSGSAAALDENGYQQTAQLCCHHEMSLFVRREIEKQGFHVCDLSDLHGFVHWYDCTDDQKTFAAMQAEIAGAMTGNCPWLGHHGDHDHDIDHDHDHCPAKHQNCFDYPPCPAAFPENSLPGSSAPLDQAGFGAVAQRCCGAEMEEFVRREIAAQGLFVCDEGSVRGFVNWFECTDDGQTFEKLKEGLVMARSGLPPMCPWLGSAGEACPPKGHNCPVVEVPEPAAHRRRTACR